MIDSEKMESLINERKKLLPDDPRIGEIWDELTQIFSEDEKDTIKYLNNCSGSQLEWISEVFEDISENLQSEDFIDTLEKLQKKFPYLDLEMDISYAKEVLKN
ncbi:hypothetical protein A5821_002646 [Enterococcus sp. 7F3_DIV0205]|uniref:Uncharacterized protein n=1 Tax=Candidatus Enterococcus palustris TaxID=1834189 RepID=A0AAQ3Y7T4_9ENTE|nr:hypothetical protein [Enterococcus sp. 7F3_DIV0205]OTN83076.1 hypothetical protein A5821_002999 [Enterococcus sp. 7F3_DIV0205]